MRKGNLPEDATTDTRIRTLTSTQHSNKTLQNNVHEYGVIHGTILDAAQIIAGTPLTNSIETVIQLAAPSNGTPVTYRLHTPINDVHPSRTNNVFITGTHTISLVNPDADTVRMQTQITLQSGENANVFESMGVTETTEHAAPTGYTVRTWVIDTESLTELLTELIGNGCNVTVTHDTLQKTFDPHPTHSLTDGNIITLDSTPETISVEHGEKTPETLHETYATQQ